MSDPLRCGSCGCDRWRVAQTPAGPDLECTRCGDTQPLEKLVDLEGVRRPAK